MTIQDAMTRLLEVLNQRQFDALEAMIDEDCALDMPGGSRVIGPESVRNALSSVLIAQDAGFADAVIMTDASGQRGAVEATYSTGAGDRQGSFVVVVVLEWENDCFTRISLHLPHMG